jgi:hypothetical protein
MTTTATLPRAARRRWPSAATWLALGLGASLFWGPAVVLKARLGPGEKFHFAIAAFTVLLPASLFLAWRAWFDAPTRAERLARWVKLAFAGPYLGAVLVGAVTFFAGGEYDRWRSNPSTPAASGILLPLVLLTARPAMMLLEYSAFGAAAAIVVLTLFIPKGAHRPIDG